MVLNMIKKGLGQKTGPKPSPEKFVDEYPITTKSRLPKALVKAVSRRPSKTISPKTTGGASANSTSGGRGFLGDLKRAELARKFWAMLNTHNVDGCRAFLTLDCVVVVREDYEELGWGEFAVEMQSLFKSFPDMKLPHRTTEVRAEDGAVVLHEMVATGTHTGEPYVYGPCEPIKASGKHTKGDPETIIFRFRGDQICKIEWRGKGVSGPAGIYAALGGFPLM